MRFMEKRDATGITLDQATAMQLRRVKLQMSTEAGHMVTLPAVIRELVAMWEASHPDTQN